MIIPALIDFYKRNASSPLMGGPGFGYRNGPTCLIYIDSDGSLDPLRPYEFLKEQRKEMMPFSARTSGVKAHPGADKLEYVLGIGNEAKLKAFRELTEEYVSFYPNSIHSAIIKFFESSTQLEDLVEEMREEGVPKLESIVASFVIDGKLSHREPTLKEFWGQKSSDEASYGVGFCSQCQRIDAKLVDKASSIPSKKLGNSQEGKLYTVNDGVSTHSAGRSVGFPYLCLDCAEQAVAALNYMIADESHKVTTKNKTWYKSRYLISLASKGTIALWDDKSTEESPSEQVAEIVSFYEAPGKIDVDGLHSIQNAVSSNIQGGKEVRAPLTDSSKMFYLHTRGRQATVTFSSSIQVKTVEEVVSNIGNWCKEASVVNSFGDVIVPGVKMIESGVCSPGAKPDESLVTALTLASLSGEKLPRNAGGRAMRRIFTDKDRRIHKKFSVERMALIKLTLIRNYGKEVSMSLEPENKNTYYLAGRYYAVACRAQKEASNGKAEGLIGKVGMIDKNIPALIRLCETNFRSRIKQIRRTSPGFAFILEKTASECWDALSSNEIRSLSRPNEQDKMMMLLGFYHQDAALWKKSDKSDKNTESNSEGEEL